MAEKIGRAPGDLGVLQSFVNTLDIEQSTDELSDSAALQSWLEQVGLYRDSDGRAAYGGRRAAHPDHPAAADFATAIQLREVLRTVLRWHVTHGPARAEAGNRQGAAANSSRPCMGNCGRSRPACPPG